MLRISKQVDYGILLLAHCSSGPRTAIHSTRDLAAESGLPVPMVSKILKGLAREGILESFRGTKGGYSLALGADEITVASIVHALEGPVRLVDCASQTLGPCRFRGQCRVVHPMQALANSVRELLERTTLEELISIPAEESGNGNGNGSTADDDASPFEGGACATEDTALPDAPATDTPPNGGSSNWSTSPDKEAQ